MTTVRQQDADVSRSDGALGMPAPLKPGDYVRIIAPSGPVDRERFAAGVAQLERWGWIPRYDDTVFARKAYLAGSDQQRLESLLEALSEPDTGAIWCARGGYGATRLLPSVPTAAITACPRWLIGFSDITALHARWHQAGLQSLHGANITGLAGWSDEARGQLYGWLTGEGATTTLNGTLITARCSVQGRLLGGNLTVLAALAGTGFLPDFTDAVVFLEDIAERPYRLDRSLTQLVQSGIFTRAKGFVIGQLTNCGDDPATGQEVHGCSALQTICQVLEPLQVPILADVAVGHERCSMPLPLGMTAILDGEAAQLRFVTHPSRYLHDADRRHR